MKNLFAPNENDLELSSDKDDSDWGLNYFRGMGRIVLPSF